MPRMTPAPIPANEDDRLQALRALLILDTPPEERFDRIAAFAAEEFDAKSARVTLVDSERQWFKAAYGESQGESPRVTSFCGHAILEDTPLVVPDALLDPRFSDNPNVTGPPHIRFYAGAPLILPTGQSVGTLCVFDEQPKEMDRVSLAILSALRDLVVEELVRRAPQDEAAA